MIYTLSWKEALLITILRVIIVNFILGTFLNISFFLGLFGGIMSTIVMGIVKNTSLSLVTNSVLGAITHNLTQLLVVIFFVQHSGILYYAPFLILFGIITGSVNGIIGRYVIKSLEKILGVNDEKK